MHGSATQCHTGQPFTPPRRAPRHAERLSSRPETSRCATFRHAPLERRRLRGSGADPNALHIRAMRAASDAHEAQFNVDRGAEGAAVVERRRRTQAEAVASNMAVIHHAYAQQQS